MSLNYDEERERYYFPTFFPVNFRYLVDYDEKREAFQIFGLENNWVFWGKPTDVLQRLDEDISLNDFFVGIEFSRRALFRFGLENVLAAERLEKISNATLYQQK